MINDYLKRYLIQIFKLKDAVVEPVVKVARLIK